MPLTDSGTEIFITRPDRLPLWHISVSVAQDLWSFPSPKSQDLQSVRGKEGFHQQGLDPWMMSLADGAHESRGHKETSAPFCTVLSCLEESRLLVEEKLWRVRHQVRDLRGMLEWNAIDIIKRPKNVVIRIFTDQIKAIHYKSNTHRPSIDTCHIASYFARRELDN